MLLTPYAGPKFPRQVRGWMALPPDLFPAVLALQRAAFSGAQINSRDLAAATAKALQTDGQRPRAHEAGADLTSSA